MAQIFTRGEVFHPAFEKIPFTVLDVKTSADLKISTIFIHSVDEKFDKDLVKALNILAPEYRKKLSVRMQLKFLPQIRFEIDRHIDDKIRLEKLLDTIGKEKV
jgi:ribosome-binding factor A